MQLAIPGGQGVLRMGAGCMRIKCCGQESQLTSLHSEGLLFSVCGPSFTCCLLSSSGFRAFRPRSPKLKAPACGVLLPKLRAPACECSYLWVLLSRLSLSYLWSAPTKAQSAPACGVLLPKLKCSYLWSAPACPNSRPQVHVVHQSQ